MMIQSDINDINIQKQNINQSNFFFEANNPAQIDKNSKKKNFSKSLNTNQIQYNNKINIGNLGNSIMPLGNFGFQEIEEKEEVDSGQGSKVNSKNNNVDKNNEKEKENENDDDLGFEYMEDDDDNNEEEKVENDKKDKNDKKRNVKSSVLKMSLNNNLFEFGAGDKKEDDFNKEMELKMEINELIKDKNNLDDKLKLSLINNNELKKIIEQKDKEIEELKKK